MMGSMFLGESSVLDIGLPESCGALAGFSFDKGAAAPAGAVIKLAMAKTIMRRLQPARMRICIAPSCVGKNFETNALRRPNQLYTPPQRDVVMYRDRLGLSTR